MWLTKLYIFYILITAITVSLIIYETTDGHYSRWVFVLDQEQNSNLHCNPRVKVQRCSLFQNDTEPTQEKAL